MNTNETNSLTKMTKHIKTYPFEGFPILQNLTAKSVSQRPNLLIHKPSSLVVVFGFAKTFTITNP